MKLETIRIVPDKKEYAVGDTAELFLTAPFSPAEGFLTVRVGGIVEKQFVKLDGTGTVVKVPIAEGYMPSVTIVVDATGSAPRMNDKGEEDPALPRRPAHATGSITLAVPPVTRTLTVEAVPDATEIEPGAATHVSVTVKDSAGAPVSGAEVAIVVVDESVLALTGYRIGDPVDTFYSWRNSLGQTHRVRELLLLQDPTLLLQLGATRNGAPGAYKMARAEGGAMPAPTAAPAPAPPSEPMEAEAAEESAKSGDDASGGEDKGGDDGGAIAVRKNFDPLAVFAGAVSTDANGVVRVAVNLPDNLTRYRVTAVAVDAGTRFGMGESSITARLPLMVRPAAPRFLNFGDSFELPIVLQNQSKEPLEVHIAVASTGVTLTKGKGRKVTVPALDRVEVRFPAETAHAGIGRFQIGAKTGKWADAAKIELPIWTPATTEAFATYGTIDKGAVAQPVKLPGDVFTQFGGLEVSTASTNLQALTDAVMYLVSYPFECSEQVSSRILAIAAMKDVLTAFKTAGLPPPEELVAAVGRDLKRLELLQHDNGGFSFWKRSERDWPYLTVHVLHAMARAKQKGFEVGPRMLQKAEAYVRDIRNHFPREYTPEIRRVIEAYALYVRNLLGDKDAKRARGLIAEMGGVTKADLESTGWLLNVLTGDAASTDLIAEIHRHLLNNLAETAGAAHFVTSYGDHGWLTLHSDRRVDGIILEALIGSDEKSDLIPKLVEGLLGHRKAGRWLNTQENVFILLALDRYFNTFEKITPNFVARVWLGDKYAGDHTFKGRTTERHQIDIPMRQLTSTEQDLIVQKDGQGRLYYRVGMRYAPKNLRLEPADHGFYVERTYESVDKPDDVKKHDNGVWHVKAGARVRVKLTMVAEGRRTHVALVDPLPAGFEALNPDLVGTQRAAPEATPDPGEGGGEEEWGGSRHGRWWWWGPWYEHENLRDERVEAFTSLLWGGVHTYTYVARATTPGIFVAPPTKAEEMYMPETFGRSGSDTVVVE